MQGSKLIDLHTHTIYSDGDLTSVQLINLAKEKNIGTISITDHDTISGYKEINSYLDNDLNQELKELEDYGIEYFLNMGGNFGKIDVSKLLIEYNYANTIQDTFNYYLSYIHEKTKHLKEECFELILKSGGIPVLAHPYTLKLMAQELNDLIKEMMKNGFKGIEFYHSKCFLENLKSCLEIANLNNLLISGGVIIMLLA